MPITITPKIVREDHLYYKEGSSDKVYHLWMDNVGANYRVHFKYGRRGSTLTQGTKTPTPVGDMEAKKIYQKILDEKMGKGYMPMPAVGKSTIPFPPTVVGPPMASEPGVGGFPSESAAPAEIEAEAARVGGRVHPMLLNPIDEDDLLLKMGDPNWILQQKHDGKRLILSKKGEKILAFNKLGKGIPVPEEYCSALQTAFAEFDFMIDGEACGPVFWAFDILAIQAHKCTGIPYEDRLLNLGMLLRSVDQSVIREVTTAVGKMEKKSLFRELQERGAEGVVLKDRREHYIAGRPNNGHRCVKFKFIASATCLVLGVNAKRSVEIGLPEVTPTRLLSGCVSIGNVTIPVNHEIPEKGDLVEVQYLYAYRGGSLYQPVYKGKRDDAETDSLKVLKYKEEAH